MDTVLKNGTCHNGTAAHDVGDVNRQVDNILARALNRVDVACFKAPWGKACPYRPTVDISEYVRAHLLGPSAAKLLYSWETLNGKKIEEHGAFRLGTYSPDPNGMSIIGTVDLDGGHGHALPIKDPLAVAIEILKRAKSLGLPCYLEKSSSGDGWHVWFFFLVKLPAATIRRLLRALLPATIEVIENGNPKLMKGEEAAEVFPKNDENTGQAGVGNQVWLWGWFGAKEGCNQFYSVGPDDKLSSGHIPDDFETITPEAANSALLLLAPEQQEHPTSIGDDQGDVKILFPNNPPAWPNKQPPDKERDWQTVLETLKHIPNGTNVPYEGGSGPSWLAVGMAINDTNPGAEGLAAWEAWSATSSKHNKKCTCAEKWVSFHELSGKRHTVASLIHWARQNGWTGPAADKNAKPNEAVDSPMRLACLFVAKYTHADGLTLRRRQEVWWKWDGKRWVIVPDDELFAELCRVIHEEFVRVHLRELARWEKLSDDERKATPKPTVRKVTRTLVANVELNLSSLTEMPGDVVPPAWWNGTAWVSRSLVALENGLLDLDAFFAEQSDVMLPHSPKWFSPISLPYPFDIKAEHPTWDKFLQRNLEADAERIALLQEWFGYCLLRDTTRQKFLLMVGEGANGKSVVCAALEAVLGSENCSHVPLESFGERFQLHGTIGKLANVVAEIGEIDRAAEGCLKAFTAGDVMYFERKYKDAIKAVPTARLVLSTNNLPRFSDKSGGLWRRMILMPFRICISEDDPNRIYGLDKVDWWVNSGELPALFCWSLVGIERLRRQNRFTESQVCKEALGEYRVENNPARLFLIEKYVEKADGETVCANVYRAYVEWCKENGYAPLASRSFGKEVRRAFSRVERREKGTRDDRYYAYVGITERQTW